MKRKPLRVVAHRGASACAPENTLGASETAVSVGAMEVEADAALLPTVTPPSSTTQRSNARRTGKAS